MVHEIEFESAVATALAVIHLLETSPHMARHEKLGRVTYALLDTINQLKQQWVTPAAARTGPPVLLAPAGRQVRDIPPAPPLAVEEENDDPRWALPEGDRTVPTDALRAAFPFNDRQP